MGYRSDVRILIYGDDKDKLDALITKHKLKGFSFGYGTVRRYSAAPTHFLDISYEGIEWYEDSEFTRAHYELMEDAENWECDYEMRRIGDDYTDIETLSSENSGWFLGVDVRIVATLPDDITEETTND